jgi:uncharacterized repeat protein (TIGR03803 family)
MKLTFLMLALYIIPAGVLVNAQTLNTVHDFAALVSDTNFDGSEVCSPLLPASDGSLYGTAQYGGTNGTGTAFKFSSAGGFKLLHAFGPNPQQTNLDGAYPYSGVVEGSDGCFYGTTVGGGSYGYGTVFKMTSNGVVTLLHSFDYHDGENPTTPLVPAGGGFFYGTTALGSSNSSGSIFSIGTNGQFQSLHAFSASWTNAYGRDTNFEGEEPYGALVLNNGALYGATAIGGAYGNGAIFRFVPTNGTCTVLHSFDPSPFGANYNGALPYGGLALGTNGLLWGTTSQLGLTNAGTIFQVTTDGVFTVVHTLRPEIDGSSPRCTLLLGSNGDFYGTTQTGGTNFAGTIFKISESGTFSVVCTFGGTNDGSAPYAGLCVGADGNMYGTTWDSGAQSNGTIFELVFPVYKLSITPSAGKKVVVASAQWQTVTPAPTVVAGRFVVTNNATVPKSFYRLRQ